MTLSLFVLAILYLSTAVVFLSLDAVMLGRVMRPLFERHLGDSLRADIRLLPAALFYLAYLAGVLWFVSLPAVQAGAPGQAFLAGAALGALAYGTYEFTSYAVMKRWHWTMVAADVTWGAALTGFAAWVGVVIAVTIA